MSSQMRPVATIIGGHGFVGRHLMAHLTQDGWDCWVPEKNDPDILRRPLGCVFYCAGLTADYAQRSFDVIEAHVSVLNSLLHHADYSSLVYLSSTRLYDTLTKELATEADDLCLNPSNRRHIYDLSKALGESLCHVAGKGKARIARLSCVYHDIHDADGFLPALLRTAQEASPGQRIAVDSSPAYARDYIGMEDVIRGLVDIATRGKQTIYNLASGENIQNAELFSLIHQICGVEIAPLSDQTFPTPARICVSRLETEFGWRPASLRKRLPNLLKVKLC